MNILDTLKKSLIMVFLGLPLILVCVVFFLGFGLGNTGMLFLSLGQIVIVPIAVMITHLWHLLVSESSVNNNEITQLVPSSTVIGTTKAYTFSTYWMAHLTFFCTYVFVNALDVYNMPSIASATDDPLYQVKVSARKTRAMLIMLFVSFTFLLLASFRYMYTGAETFFGALLAIPVFFGLGYGWYKASATIGVKQMDMFGIIQQMILVKDPTKPQMCVSQG
jgi:hypothetical protein